MPRSAKELWQKDIRDLIAECRDKGLDSKGPKGTLVRRIIDMDEKMEKKPGQSDFCMENCDADTKDCGAEVI